MVIVEKGVAYGMYMALRSDCKTSGEAYEKFKEKHLDKIPRRSHGNSHANFWPAFQRGWLIGRNILEKENGVFDESLPLIDNPN